MDVTGSKKLKNSLALVRGAEEALTRDDLPPSVRARMEKAKAIGEAGLRKQLEDVDEPAGHA